MHCTALHVLACCWWMQCCGAPTSCWAQVAVPAPLVVTLQHSLPCLQQVCLPPPSQRTLRHPVLLQHGAPAPAPHARNPRQAHSQFESLDYELCDNTVYKADEALKGPADPLVYRAVKYSICGLIGVSIAATAFGVNFGVENIAGTRFWLLFTASRCARAATAAAAAAACTQQHALRCVITRRALGLPHSGCASSNVCCSSTASAAQAQHVTPAARSLHPHAPAQDSTR